MPIYSYKCKKCSKVFDFLKIKKSDTACCPGCGSTDLEKQITAPASVRVGNSRAPGTTCCGRDERCDTPPCTDGSCVRE